MRRQEGVRRFKVTVYNSEIVQRLQRFQKLQLDTHSVCGDHRAARDPIRQGLSLEEFQYQKESVTVFEHIEDLANAWMAHSGERSGLPPQPSTGIFALRCLANGLDCDGSLQPFIPTLVHYSHSAFSDLAAD